MGIGIAVMENLLVNYHVGYCIDCQEWMAFTKNLCGSFTDGTPESNRIKFCPYCGKLVVQPVWG